MRLNVAPEAVLAAYRVGDSPVNAISPLNAYFAMIVTFAQRYQKDAGVGTVVALMLPYVGVLFVVWTLMLAGWYLLGLPWGLGCKRTEGSAVATRSGSRQWRVASLFGPWPRRCSIALLGIAGTLISPPSARAQNTNQDTTDDGQAFLFDVLYGMPDREEPLVGDSRLATDPGAEQQAPTPVFYFRTLAPLNYTSNAESLRSGGTRTTEGSPEVRLGFASQIPELPLRFSASVALEFDRFVDSNSAEFDKIRPRAQLQYVDSNDDQAFSPFVGFSPRLDFTPTLDDNTATRYDLNVGIMKAFNFDGEFNRVPASGNTFAATRLRLGFTLIGQRRFREPSPASYALILAPSVSYRISEDWSAALAIEATRRWFERIASTSQENFTLEPVAALEYDIPERWLGGPEMARWFGRPAVDFFGGVERNWSNVASARFTRVYAGFAFKAAWRF
jgi:hypothetical protein